MNARRRCTVLIILLGLLIGVMANARHLYAQTDSPAEPTANAAEPEDGDPASQQHPDSMLGQIVQQWRASMTGKVFILVLAGLSLVAGMTAIERLLNTTRKRIVPSDFVLQLEQLSKSSDPQPEAFTSLSEQSKSPVSKVLQAGLLRIDRPLVEIEKTMEDALAREMAATQARTRPLSVVATVAPLVGLLGTVIGMIDAFRTASQAGLGKGELMAEGIYMALFTTAAGLTIAIPCLLIFAWLRSQIEKLYREMDERLMPVFPAFSRMQSAAQRQPEFATESEPALQRAGR